MAPVAGNPPSPAEAIVAKPCPKVLYLVGAAAAVPQSPYSYVLVYVPDHLRRELIATIQLH